MKDLNVVYMKRPKEESPVISRKPFIMKQAEVKVLFCFFFSFYTSEKK